MRILLTSSDVYPQGTIDIGCRVALLNYYNSSDTGQRRLGQGSYAAGMV